MDFGEQIGYIHTCVLCVKCLWNYENWHVYQKRIWTEFGKS